MGDIRTRTHTHICTNYTYESYLQKNFDEEKLLVVAISYCLSRNYLARHNHSKN